jgi:hypothetical protein
MGKHGEFGSRPGSEKNSHSDAPPTVDRMRDDISRGKTGDKINYPDPAAAPLGTDDEAAGRPATSQERRMEEAARPLPARARIGDKPPRASASVFYAAIVLALLIVVLAGALLTR